MTNSVSSYINLLASAGRRKAQKPLIGITTDGSVFDLRKEGYIVQVKNGPVIRTVHYKVVEIDGKDVDVVVPSRDYEEVWDMEEKRWRRIK